MPGRSANYSALETLLIQVGIVALGAAGLYLSKVYERLASTEHNLLALTRCLQCKKFHTGECDNA